METRSNTTKNMPAGRGRVSPVVYFLAMETRSNTTKNMPAGGQIVIYTDGGCIGNPGPGGYGAVVQTPSRRFELSGGFRLTTNNRMEVTAAITALQSLDEPGSVLLYSDSRYLVDAMSKGWAEKWRANQWKRAGGGKALNPDLWERLLELCKKRRVRFAWVAGHTGNPENERCDRLSVAAAKQKGLPPDIPYEQLNARPAPQRRLF
jgi:ribonuclease HI